MNQLMINRNAKQRKVLLMGGLLFLFILIGMVYWFYWAEPEPFPPEEEVIAKLNQLAADFNPYYPEVTISRMEEVLFLDERHAFVPLITEEGKRGFSVWRCQRHRWQVEYITTRGQPRLVKLDDDRPGSYHLVWHMHPADQVDKLRFYLIRKRDFSYSDGKELYLPGIEMATDALLTEKPYGALPLPKEWVTVLETLMPVEAQRSRLTGEDGLFGRMFHPPTVYFSWLPLDGEGKEAFLEHSVNGDDYQVGQLSVDYIFSYDPDSS